MPLQNFIARQLPAISAAWLNIVDALKFTVFNDATTKAQARAALSSDVGVFAWQGVDSGAVNAAVVTQVGPATAITLVTGLQVSFVATTPNTGAATLNFAGTGIKAIVNQLGNALTGGELSFPVTVQYNGTAWRIIQGSILPAFARTVAETAAGVVPSNYSYPVGDTRRSSWYTYGDTAYLDLVVTPTYIDTTHFTVPGDYTGIFIFNSWILLRGVSARNVGRVAAAPVFAAGITTVTVGIDLGGNMPTDLLAVFPQIEPNLFVNNTFEVNANGVGRMRLANRSTGNIAQIGLNIGVDATNNTKGGFILGATGEGYSGEAVSGSGISGASAFLYTNTNGQVGFVPIPFILAAGDFPRLLIGDGVTAYPNTPNVLFIGHTTAFRMIATQEPGSINMEFYRTNRTTRKGRIGFNSFVNNSMDFINEETGGVNIQAAAGNVALVASGSCSLNGTSYSITLAGLGNFANDAAAAAGGVPVSGWYRNGSVLQVRVV